jgi:hypothetical protein
MGGSGSKSRTTVQNKLINSAINKCPSVAVDNSIKLSKFKFKCSDQCKELGQKCIIDFNQSSAVDAQCVIQNAQSALADVFAASTASAEAGIGVAVGDSKATINTKIENYVRNECGDVGVRNAIEGQDWDIEGCEMKQIQSADTSTTCRLGVLQGIESKSTAKSEAEAKGLNPASLIFGFLLAFWMPILIGIVVLIVMIIGIKMLLGGFGGRRSGGGFAQMMPQMPQMPQMAQMARGIPRGVPMGRRR